MENEVLLLFRKNKPQFFSIERVFDTVWEYLDASLNIRKIYAVSEKASLPGIFKNLNYFRKCKAGVYHLTGEIYYAILLFPSSRSVITIHDCNYISNTAGWKGKLRKKIWFDLPVKHARFVTVISEKTRQDVIRLSGCDENKVFLIPNPLSESFTCTPKIFEQDKPRILQIGTRWNKNLSRVVEALKGLSCKLCVIGRLSENDRNLIDSSGIEYENYFDIPVEELNRQYSLSDIVVFASLSEGFGLPILEAQSTGRVVITSDLSPMKDVAGDGALLIDPEDIQSIRNALNRVINDEKLRSQLIEKGFANTKKFKSENIAGQYIDLYKTILEHK